ncbi:hypothetical protein V8J36_17075 [Frigidibacter sp. MR17.14]|uniref:hypothetical protein n=1 Tax=Frigidibacter sp. MR17.14 TaxID=3126509 RepID=UPI003012A530
MAGHPSERRLSQLGSVESHARIKVRHAFAASIPLPPIPVMAIFVAGGRILCTERLRTAAAGFIPTGRAKRCSVEWRVLRSVDAT